MKIPKNESVIDRLIRVLMGVIFLVIAYYFFTGFLQVLFYILAAIMLFTALTGFCALYKLFGINTLKNQKK